MQITTNYKQLGCRKSVIRSMSLFFLVSILMPMMAAGQTTMKGTVRDTVGIPLPGVSIQVKGTGIQSSTDANGQFQLSAEADAPILVFSYVGFITKEVPYAGEALLNVILNADNTSLDEVVVVGYGTQRKSDVTGAVASFSAEKLQLQSMPNTSISQSLQGRIPGLSVTTTAADAEGNSNELQVRGRNSITAGNAPLVVVDGIPFADQLSEINPNDIASIDVLKDASAAAIYGSRAANGVILVTTKKGKTGAPQVSYNGFFGLDEIAHLPNMMDAASFYQTKVDRYGEGALTRTEIDSRAAGVNTDWIDLATRTGTRQQHAIAISGGSEATRYYFSGAFNEVKGIAKNDDFKRINLRINLDTKITPWLTIGTNTQFGYYNRDHMAASFSGAFDMNPLALPYEEDGQTLRIFPWSEDAFFTNPLQGFDVLQEDRTRSVLSNNFVKIDVPFIPGLSYKLNTGYTYRYRGVEAYYGRNTRNGLQQGGVSEIDNWANEDWIIENILDYDRTFGNHHIAFTGLYSAQRRVNKNHDLDASGFPSDIMTNYQNSLATVWNPTDQYNSQQYISQMARLNYSYLGKYLLTLTARRDGYSAFGEDSKFGIFPSVALGWNMHEEAFIKTTDWLDQLKWRVSYGKNGNQAIDPYSTLPQLQPLPYLDNDKQTAIGFYPSRLGDPALGWETTKQFNVGADFAMLKNRVVGSIDYYRAETTDLLLDKLISPVNGTKSIRQNIGKTTNRGIDLAISGIAVDKKDFNWTVDLNFSHYKNKIVDVGLYDAAGNPVDYVDNRWFIGQPISVNYSYIFDGIWQEGDDIANSAQPTANPGDVRVKDVNNDGTISAADRDIIGSTVPSFTAGITNTFRYKNLSLSFFIRTVQGVTKFNELMNSYFDGRTRTLNRSFWTPENPINTFPANRDDSNPFGVIYFGKQNNASFIRLNDVTLKYQFSASQLKRIGLHQLEVFINAKNLTTITHWEGLDPELSSQRAIPQTRAYLLGLRFGI
ncbi:TonB-dependent receptor [Olivibacter sp. XZL3]|uniref:SusC/RagA family TonB-linked outer membrane protein n=1 Tax=Olivibacter sp. XZL3 TaxID=1735116 RepID=UPI0010657DC9|nr:TonB-dependent receptor [Olivibacter sp. XZL3]